SLRLISERIMSDLHVFYPSDDGPERDGSVPRLHIIRDDQGDYYLSVSNGEKQGWTSVRLCGGSGGGAADKAPDFYTSIAMATGALAGERDRVLCLARDLLGHEIARLERELRSARRVLRESFRQHVEHRKHLERELLETDEAPDDP